MMPVKDILAMRPHIPGPPVLVIDETSIEQCHDAGPVCGCHEKYQMIQNYSPFLPGGINPYNKKTNISESDCFDVTWKNIKIGSHDLLLEKPFARHICELPSNREVKKNGQNDEDLMHITPPRYTEAYHRQKMRECPREHFVNCDCFIQNSEKDDF